MLTGVVILTYPALKSKVEASCSTLDCPQGHHRPRQTGRRLLLLAALPKNYCPLPYLQLTVQGKRFFPIQAGSSCTNNILMNLKIQHEVLALGTEGRQLRGISASGALACNSSTLDSGLVDFT